MTRKTHAGIIVVILIAAIFTIEAQSPSVHGQEIRVVDDDPLDEFCLDQYNDGAEPDYSTINDAIDDSSDGDTIIVCKGTYTEEVIIDVAGLTFLGFGCTKTIIDPPGATNAISLNADRTTIIGFDITGGDDGIESFSSDEIDLSMIRENCIHNNTADGIHFDRGNRNLILNNDIFSNGSDGIFFGIDSSTSNFNWIGNNKVRDNTRNGIIMEVDDSNDNEIDGNEVRGHGATFWGIEVDSDILVTGNKVISNNGGGILARGDDNTFFANTSNQNGKEGFRTSDSGSSMNTFDKNTAKGNGEEGFSDKGTMNTFTRNTAKSNTLEGFGYEGTNSVFTDNAARMNTQQGFFIMGGDDGTFDGNRARNNGDDGFEADSTSSGNSFDSNKSNSNGGGGAGYGFNDASAGPANTYASNKCNGNFSGGSFPTPGAFCTPQA